MANAPLQRVLLCFVAVLALTVAGAAASRPTIKPFFPTHPLTRPFGVPHPSFSEWTQMPSPNDLEGFLSEDHIITVMLKQSNLNLVKELFYDVSNPKSPNYGRYLSREQVARLVSPSEDVLHRVCSWLHENGATSVQVYQTKDAIRAILPRRNLEQMLAVKFHTFTRSFDGRKMIRSLTLPQVPEQISKSIDFIRGITDFPSPRRSKFNQINSKKPVYSDMPLEKFQRLIDNAVAGQPIVSAVISRVSFTVEFTPICLNGQPSKTVPPCQEFPPAVDAVYFSASTISTVVNRTWDQYEPIGFGTCTTSNPDGSVACKFEWAPSQFWFGQENPFNVSVSLSFDNTTGPWGSNPFPTSAVPPVIPQTLAKQYSIPPNYVITEPKGTQAVVEFEQQYYSPSDLNLFFNAMGLPNDTPVTVVGPNDETNPGGEANLDIQYIMGVAVGVPTTFWSIAANSSVEIDDILQWCLQMENTTNPPLVNSLSYGMSENQVDKYLGNGYLARSDVEFQKLALQGITIIIASGDTGCGDLGAPPMSNPTCETLHPDWPSQSPYVTSVGSTFLTPIAEPICFWPPPIGIDCSANPIGEVGVSLEQGIFFTTGGGFSANDSVSTPSYQASVVENYIKNAGAAGLLPPSNMWNSAGRGYPDFSAVGHNLMVALSGQIIPVDGTSASAPIFAGVVALLNEVLLSAGKSSLGFLNPLLYQIAQEHPQAFYDVTVGSIRCGAYHWTPLCCDYGFSALPGWDPVGGLGSPNFQVLSEILLA